MGWDDGATAGPAIRRRTGMSNFTATLGDPAIVLSREKITTSAIIKSFVEVGYEIWKVFPDFRMGGAPRGSRVWELW
jgi:hypothetical protein